MWMLNIHCQPHLLHFWLHSASWNLMTSDLNAMQC